MEAIERWIVSVTALSLLVGICRGLTPEGSARRVGGMVSALLLFVAAVSPLRRLRLEHLGDAVSAWAERYEGYSSALEETDRALTRGLVEEQCAAYLERRAGELGCPCAVTVMCREQEGLSVPARARVTGTLRPEQRERLRALAASELGLEGDALSFEEAGP